MNEDASIQPEHADPPNGFTEEDLTLGKKAVKIMRALCVVAMVACAGIAIFVFMNVPWETRMPYNGRFDNSGDGLPMQIAMLPILVVEFGLWRSGSKSDAHHMRKGSRIGLYVLGTAIVVGGIVGQLIMAKSILVEGGYLAG